jgi:hypothetical protein
MAQKKPAKIEIGGKKYKIGNAVGSGEFREIAEATGRPLSDLRERILNKGFSLGSSGKNYYKQNKKTVNQQDGEQGDGDGTQGTGIQVKDAAFPWDDYADLQKDLGEIQAGAVTESEKIRGLSNQEIARLIRMRLIMVTIVSLKELSTLRTPKSVGGKLLPQSRATRKRPSKTSLTPA